MCHRKPRVAFVTDHDINIMHEGTTIIPLSSMFIIDGRKNSESPHLMMTKAKDETVQYHYNLKVQTVELQASFVTIG